MLSFQLLNTSCIVLTITVWGVFCNFIWLDDCFRYYIFVHIFDNKLKHVLALIQDFNDLSFIFCKVFIFESRSPIFSLITPSITIFLFYRLSGQFKLHEMLSERLLLILQLSDIVVQGHYCVLMGHGFNDLCNCVHIAFLFANKLRILAVVLKQLIVVKREAFRFIKEKHSVSVAQVKQVRGCSLEIAVSICV